MIGQINKIFGLSDFGNKWINGVHKHARANDIRDYLGKNLYDQYFKFSFVRNPYDWLVSLYHYIKGSKAHRDYKLANELSFKDYVNREINNKPYLQSDFLTDENGFLIVDYIGHTENIQAAMNYIFNKLDIGKKNIGHENFSSRDKNYLKYYDKQLKKDVYFYFKKDFEIFGYEK